MKILIGCFVVTIFLLSSCLIAQEPFDSELLTSGQRWLNFQHRAFKEMTVFESHYSLLNATPWSLNVIFGIQNLCNSYIELNPSFYAVCYSINLNLIYTLWSDKLDLTLSTFHQSSHLDNFIKPKILNDVDEKNLNLFRLGLTLKNHNNFWSSGLQTNPKEIFNGTPYKRYQQQVYFNAGYTTWRNSNHRLAIYLAGETAINTCFAVKLQYSTNLNDAIWLDRWQLFLTYENKMSKALWFIGAKIVF